MPAIRALVRHLRFHLIKVATLVFATIALSGPAFAARAPENPDKPARGIEGGSWSLENWGNSGGFDKLIHGKRKVLKLTYMAGDKPKTSFKHLTGHTADPAGHATFWVYAPMEKPPAVALAISTTPAYIWHESKEFPIKKGWNKIEVPLGKGHWKTEASKWAYNVGIEHIDQIRAINLIVLNGKETGWLLFEGLHLSPDAQAKQVQALIDEMTGLDFERQAKAETELLAIGRPALEMLYQASASNRPEVLLRASFTLRKILDTEEDLPQDPKLKEQILTQREEQYFNQAKVRVNYVLSALKTERAKILGLLKDARSELARGKEEAENLKYTEMEDRKAFAESLDELDALSLMLLRVFEEEKEKPEGEAAGEAAMKPADPKTEPAPKKPVAKPDEKAATMKGGEGAERMKPAEGSMTE